MTTEAKLTPAARQTATRFMRRRIAELRADESSGPLSIGTILQALQHHSEERTWSGLPAPLLAGRLMRISNIPARHHARRPRGTNALWDGACSRIVRGIGAGMLVGLIGQRGTGKTQIAVTAMLEAMALRKYALYTKAMDVFLTLRSIYSTDDVAELDAVAEFLAPDLLVIDEVAERGETKFEDQRLTYIIDKRYDALKDTILIANLNPAEFAESLGPSITDRLRECGGLVVCDWPSFRTGTP